MHVVTHPTYSNQSFAIGLQVKPLHMDWSAPIIIGGLGGSGTRIVTQIIHNVGVYIHNYQNRALDNIFFSRIVSAHPSLRKYSHRRLRSRLDAFTRLYAGKPLTPGQLILVYRSMKKPRPRQTWLLLRRSAEHRKEHRGYAQWCFKNPRTQFFLPQLATHFPGCRYIHIIRNGLDMAFSSNTNQLQHWGADFNIDENNPLPVRQLDFWIAVNHWVLQQCQLLLPERHYVLSFDDLCSHPEEEIDKLITFLHLEPERAIEELAQLVERPAGSGRYRAHPNIFSPEQIQAVGDLGFDVAYT